MCGIIGYTGEDSALPILLRGLRTLEYRGYDSAGVALFCGEKICTVKSQGRIASLEEKLKEYELSDSVCGIGHTRWATHGEPSDKNAHPHGTANVMIVHNGIIENYAQLESRLRLSGYSFESDTDTEAAAKLIDFYYNLSQDPISSLFAAASAIRGSFAFGVVFSDKPDEIYAIRRDSPLIAALGKNGAFIASDIPALLPHTNEFYRLPENVAMRATKDAVEFFDKDGNSVEVEKETVEWNVAQAQKSGYPHFMLKEIFEEPESLRKTLLPRIVDGLPSLEELPRNISKIHIVACGTAMHAGLIGKAMIERMAKIPVTVEVASEFRYREAILGPDDLVLLLSQSGETADTLAALRYAKEHGIRTLAIVNCLGSSIAREADNVIYTLAGPEIAVASTKAYSVQAALLCLVSAQLSIELGTLFKSDVRDFCQKLSVDAVSAIEKTLQLSESIRKIIKEYINGDHLFYIGRGIDCDLCAEGSLKLKEISYIHSEAYAAGELKHGTISLITDGVPVIALLTEKALAEKTVSAIREVKSRGAHVLVIATDEIADSISIPYDDIIRIPHIENRLSLFPAATVLQLLAYHASAQKGLDVDKPRNLAKSVTVE